jgi:hypothetical protein
MSSAEKEGWTDGEEEGLGGQVIFQVFGRGRDN